MSESPKADGHSRSSGPVAPGQTLPADRATLSRPKASGVVRLSRVLLTSAAILAVAFFGHFAGRRAPQILVKPYVQPGAGGTVETEDGKVICWLTDATPGEFAVDYWPRDGELKTVVPQSVALSFPAPGGVAGKLLAPQPPNAKPADKDRNYRKYSAVLDRLPPDSSVRYRVRQGSVVIRESSFRTRASADRPFRFVLVGDMASGQKAQNAIAWQIHQAKPEFLVALGDVVYPTGRVSQYMDHFWTTYNDVDRPSATTGAPLMASVPFYAVLGNHDVSDKLPATVDALGAFYFFHPPQRGPGDGPWNTPLGNDEGVARRFRSLTPHSYPWLDAYSFDYGAAHMVVLNNNRSADAAQPALRAWAERDLKSSAARWKIVCFHVPAFHTSTQHGSEQHMRLWQPMFESTGVDLAFAGHVHNYQRSMPLKFAPDAKSKDSRGRVDGTFTLDTLFDGARHTRADGVIHIVAGGGGASLHQPPSAAPAKMPGVAENNPAPDLSADLPAGAAAVAELPAARPFHEAEYVSKHVADRHTFVTVDLSPERLTLTAIDLEGHEVDRIVMTKP